MELRQLQYLVAVADEASFTRAAARAHVAQPGVSAQIRRLERELGQLLLDRSGGTVRVTEAGAAVLPYARAALAAVDAVRDTVDALAGLTRGHVTAGIVGAISSPDLDLPGLLAGFHRDHPGIEITLTEAGSDWPGCGPPPRIRDQGPPHVFACHSAGPAPAARAHRARLESRAAGLPRSPRLHQPRAHAAHPPGHASGRRPVAA